MEANDHHSAPTELRRADAEDGKAQALGLHRSHGALEVITHPHSNERRAGLSFVQSLMMSVMVTTTALLAYHYAGPPAASQAAPAPPKAVPIVLDSPKLGEVERALKQQGTEQQGLSAQLAAANTRLDGLRQDLSQSQKQFSEALSQLTAAPKAKTSEETVDQIKAMALHFATMQSQFASIESRLKSVDTQLADTMAKQAMTKSGGSTSTILADVSSTESSRELVLLKERNRLTLLADEAISTGKAAPVRRLWASVRDPELENVKHGTAAELIRVQNHFMSFTRLSPSHKLKPADPTIKEVDMPVPELVKVLENDKGPFLDRARAAQLLGKHRTATAARALVAAMEKDEEIDVVKEAQLSLRHSFGLTAPIFDADLAQQWLKLELPQLKD
jgi:hypothetical protein